jgi:hypothetical protein
MRKQFLGDPKFGPDFFMGMFVIMAVVVTILFISK